MKSKRNMGNSRYQFAINSWFSCPLSTIKLKALKQTNKQTPLKNGVFYVVTPCGSCKNRYLVFLRSVRRLLVAACVVPSSPIFVTLMKEAPDSSETSVLTRASRRNNPEDTILHSHRRENLKSYKLL
jgi:hypothetical protein